MSIELPLGQLSKGRCQEYHHIHQSLSIFEGLFIYKTQAWCLGQLLLKTNSGFGSVAQDLLTTETLVLWLHPQPYSCTETQSLHLNRCC